MASANLGGLLSIPTNPLLWSGGKGRPEHYPSLQEKTLVEEVSQDWGNQALKGTQVLRPAATATLRSVNTPDCTRISFKNGEVVG